MGIFHFTGHPFVDAGIAGIAAILEKDGKVFNTPEDIGPDDVWKALELLKSLYYQRIAEKKGTNAKKTPMFSPLLREVIPGSSWDQTTTGVELAKAKQEKFENLLTVLKKAIDAPPIGYCFLTGNEAHMFVDKSEMPLLASSEERPNCYPNLGAGFPASTWITLAVLFSPLSIEKTIKEDGKGSSCLIYHTANWRFMVGVAQRNLRRLRLLLSANSIEEFRTRFYKGKPRSGTWKMALLTMLRVLNRVDKRERPQVSVWSFNASNQSCRYECIEISSSFLEIYDHRQLYPNVYQEVRRCSDTVSRLILEGKPIAQKSIIERDPKKELKNADRLARTLLQPGWSLQRLYAEKVLKMPTRLLDAVERAAKDLAQDSDAVRYCLDGNIRPEVLASRYKLTGDLIAIFADYPRSWKDYLRAAVLWSYKGEVFGNPLPVADKSGEFELMIKQVAERLRSKHGYKRLAMRLNVSVPRRYREAWIRLLNDGACTWEDFLAFNPLEEALSIGRYSRTRTLRDYLVGYLLGCTNVPEQQEVAEEDEEPLETINLEFTDEEEEA